MANILLIDDDSTLHESIADWFAAKGDHRVQSAVTASAAWELMCNWEKIDLVILDWDLPDMTGIELLRKFRRQNTITPVIMVTGHASVDDRADGLDSGADDYLPKPFSLKELTSRVNAQLRKAKQIPASAQPLGTGNEDILKAANLIGTSLPTRYEFLDVVGTGGMGTVFRARHPHLQRLVAIKMIHPEHESFSADDVYSRFQQEARVVSGLNHPNVAAVYDFGMTEKNQPYMVMEFIDGGDLSTLVQTQGNIQVLKALDIVRQVAGGMFAAHDAGIIHRDLKPSNLMLLNGNDGFTVKVVDFGCAKLRQTREQPMPVSTRPVVPADEERFDLTRQGTTIGTPLYMSPEQATASEQIDHRADIYALGCILYQLVTGEVPFTGHSTIEILTQHATTPPKPLVQRRPDVCFPPELQELIDKMLAKDPSSRVQSMQQVHESCAALMSPDKRMQREKPFWQKLFTSVLSGNKKNN